MTRTHRIALLATIVALGAGGGGAYAAFASDEPAEPEVRCLAVGSICDGDETGDAGEPGDLIHPDAPAPANPDPLAGGTYPVGEAPENPDPAA